MRDLKLQWEPKYASSHAIFQQDLLITPLKLKLDTSTLQLSRGNVLRKFRIFRETFFRR